MPVPSPGSHIMLHSKKRVSRHVSRSRPSLETPSLVTTLSPTCMDKCCNGFRAGMQWPKPEMITILSAGWISRRIVSLRPDTNIQKLLSNGNRIQLRISETLFSIFRGFRLLERLHIAQSFI